MRLVRTSICAAMLMVGSFLGPTPALAGKDDPLFVNITSDEMSSRVMGVMVAKHMAELGHPTTVFLNGKAVLIINKNMSSMYGEQQTQLKEMMSKGAVIIACAHCVEHHGMKATDLLEGVKLSTPTLMNESIFKDNTKTLSW